MAQAREQLYDVLQQLTTALRATTQADGNGRANELVSFIPIIEGKVQELISQVDCTCGDLNQSLERNTHVTTELAWRITSLEQSVYHLTLEAAQSRENIGSYLAVLADIMWFDVKESKTRPSTHPGRGALYKGRQGPYDDQGGGSLISTGCTSSGAHRESSHWQTGQTCSGSHGGQTVNSARSSQDWREWSGVNAGVSQCFSGAPSQWSCGAYVSPPWKSAGASQERPSPMKSHRQDGGQQ